MSKQSPSEIRPCWICGNPADSREHKFKRSDVTLSSKTWAPDDQPYYFGEDGARRIQGPGSDLVKFEKVLCQKCNNTRTQPFDLAYERFAEWVNQKSASIMAEAQIDFGEIYGEDFQNETANLVRYFIKHLGCRIASENYTMPSEFASLLVAADDRPFEVTFSRNSEVADFPVRGAGTLHNFPTLGFYSPTTGEVHGPFMSGMIVGYLDVIYRYEYPERYAWEGDAIQPAHRSVRLGKYIPGAPHPTNGMAPGSESARRITIGGVTFDIPTLSPKQIQHILSLGLPSADMPVAKNIDTRIKIAHAILSPFYPDVTESFLEENLTLPDSDKLWSCVFPSRRAPSPP